MQKIEHRLGSWQIVETVDLGFLTDSVEQTLANKPSLYHFMIISEMWEVVYVTANTTKTVCVKY